MKYIAEDVAGEKMEVEVTNIPIVTVEDIEVETGDEKSRAWTGGLVSYNRLTTDTNMTPMYKKHFTMISEQYILTGCVVCKDGTIYYHKMVAIS